MATLTTESLDVNTPLVQDVMGSIPNPLISTPYFEDFLFKVLADLEAINDEISAGSVTDGDNVGTGVEVFKEKDGTVLDFRTLVSADSSVTITQGVDEIDLAAASLSGTVANSILTYNLGTSEYTELPEMRVSFAGGVITFSQDDSGGAAVTMLTSDGDGQTGFFFDGTEVANTRVAADGGLFVNNLSTGAGFERVLTTADIGGGSLPAPTVNNSILTGDLGGGDFDELTEVTIAWVGGVMTIQVEDDLAALQNVIVADADGGLDTYFDGTLQTSTVFNGFTVFSGTASNAHVRLSDTNGETALIRKLQTSQGGFTQLYGEEDGENVQLLADDAAAAVQILVDGDPDGSVDIYYDGTPVLFTDERGIRLQSEDGTVTWPFIRGYNQAGTTQFGEIQFGNSVFGTLLYNTEVSGVVSLLGEDSGDDLTNLLIADPDGSVDQYHDGELRTSTAGNGSFIVHDPSNPIINLFENGIDASSWLFFTDDNVYFDNRRTTGDLIFRLSDASASDQTVIAARNGAEVELYHNNEEVFATHIEGFSAIDASNSPNIRWIAGSTEKARIQIFSDDAYFDNRDAVASGDMFLRLSDVSTSDQTVMHAINGGDTLLYYDGTPTLAARSNGGEVYDHNGDAPNLYFTQDDLTTENGVIGFNAPSSIVVIQSNIDGAELEIRQDDAAGVQQTPWDSDPDGEVRIEFDGNLAFTAQNGGIGVYDDTGTAPTIDFYTNGAVLNGLMGYNAGSAVGIFRSVIHGAPTFIQGEDAGGTVQDGIEYDPDVGLGFNAATPVAPQNYTITNPTTNRSIDVTGITLALLAEVVGTMIQDLIDYGLYT